MIYSLQILASGTAIFIGLIADLIYLRSMLWGGTKAHPFTWLVFALIDGIIFFVQLLSGGGPGAWVTGVGVGMLVVIAIVAVKNGEKRIYAADWVCLVGAMLAIAAWWLSSDPFITVVLLSSVNVFAAVPTFIKSYLRPYEESISIWSLDIIRFLLSILALSSLSLSTVFFPAGVVVANAALVAMILFRRRQLATLQATV